MALPEIGKYAPDFTAPTDDGSELRLSDLRGSIVVLYFYPRASTPSCTKEACSFRDNMIRLTGMGVKVVGVSTDSIKRQSGFKTKNELQFPLVADKELNVVKLYDVLKPETGSAQRSTFLVDREGIIRFVWSKVRVPGHVDEIISKIDELKL
ncbi:MAG: peroxiredoxin [Candidatus Hermodarchaeota archaeon]